MRWNIFLPFRAAFYDDANGNAAGAAVQIAVVQGAGMTAMTTGDFLVVA